MLFISDFIILVVSVLATVIWENSKSWGHLSVPQASGLVGLALYRLARVWVYSALPDDLAGSAIRKASARPDTFKFFFVARDATFVHHLWDELDRCWSDLADSWGPGYASKVSKIMVFCTDKDKAACERLVSAVQDTSLYKTGALQFKRPDFTQVMNRHLLGRVAHAQMSSGRYPASTSTIVAFCGGTSLGSLINSVVLLGNNMFEDSTSGKPRISHAVEFVQENYGSTTPRGPQQASLQRPLCTPCFKAAWTVQIDSSFQMILMAFVNCKKPAHDSRQVPLCHCNGHWNEALHPRTSKGITSGRSSERINTQPMRATAGSDHPFASCQVMIPLWPTGKDERC